MFLLACILLVHIRHIGFDRPSSKRSAPVPPAGDAASQAARRQARFLVGAHSVSHRWVESSTSPPFASSFHSPLRHGPVLGWSFVAGTEHPLICGHLLCRHRYSRHRRSRAVAPVGPCCFTASPWPLSALHALRFHIIASQAVHNTISIRHSAFRTLGVSVGKTVLVVVRVQGAPDSDLCARWRPAPQTSVPSTTLLLPRPPRTLVQ